MKKIFLLFAVFLSLFNASCSLAYNKEELKDTPIADDFVLGPGKTDLILNPGEKTTQQIMVTNRLGREKKFKIEIEDFSGSYNSDETVVLFGDAKGPYSLKDYIRPEITEFTLQHGERIVVPVEIEIPKDSQPGGLYASVLVSTVPDKDDMQKNTGQTKIISRLGTLFFVRVAGDVMESGYLKSFTVSDTKYGFYEKGPIPFEIAFNNDGNIHLTPSGKIEVKNLLGKKVGEITVDKYFAMPDALRQRVVKWDGGFMIGQYIATLTLDKNYQTKSNESETMSVTFWVLPWKLIAAAVAVLVVAIMLLRFISSKFKFEIKKK